MAPRLLAEAVLIVASVLLALAVDEWRESRQVARRVDTALAAFEQEIEANRAQVERQLPYHATLQARFEQITQGPPPTSLQGAFAAVPEWRGIGIPALLDVAWEAALATDVLPHMDFALHRFAARLGCRTGADAAGLRGMAGGAAGHPRHLPRDGGAGHRRLLISPAGPGAGRCARAGAGRTGRRPRHR